MRRSRRRAFFFPSRRRHTRCLSDWSSDVCSSDLAHRHVVVTAAVIGFLRIAASALGGVSQAPLGPCADCRPQNGNRLDNINGGVINVCFSGRYTWNPEVEIAGFKRGVSYWTECLPPGTGPVRVTYEPHRACNLVVANVDFLLHPTLARANGSSNGSNVSIFVDQRQMRASNNYKFDAVHWAWIAATEFGHLLGFNHCDGMCGRAAAVMLRSMPPDPGAALSRPCDSSRRIVANRR